MDERHYRPLIRINKPTDQNIYLPVDYAYSLPEVALVKKYLPKTLVFYGVDSEEHGQEYKSKFDKEKLKLKAVDGCNIVDEKPLKFYSASDLQLVKWADTWICIDVPFNPRQDAEAAKDNLDSHLEAYLSKHFHFINKHTKQFIDPNSTKPLEIHQLDIFLEPSQLPTQPFDKEYREMRLKVPVAAILSKKEKYTAATLKEYLTMDLLNCMKIMIKNELSIRVVETTSNMVLQSFVSQSAEEQGEQAKLSEVIGRDTMKEEIQEFKQARREEVQSRKEEVQSPSNGTLMLILIGMAVIYIYLKLNPLNGMLDL